MSLAILLAILFLRPQGLFARPGGADEERPALRPFLPVAVLAVLVVGRAARARPPWACPSTSCSSRWPPTTPSPRSACACSWATPARCRSATRASSPSAATRAPPSPPRTCCRSPPPRWWPRSPRRGWPRAAVDLYGAEVLRLSPWLGPLAGLLLAAAAAVLLGLPSLRLRGHYLAMATLSFGIIVHRIVIGTPALGAADGIPEIPALRIAERARGERPQGPARAELLPRLGARDPRPLLAVLNLARSRAGRSPAGHPRRRGGRRGARRGHGPGQARRLRRGRAVRRARRVAARALQRQHRPRARRRS